MPEEGVTRDGGCLVDVTMVTHDGGCRDDVTMVTRDGGCRDDVTMNIWGGGGGRFKDRKYTMRLQTMTVEIYGRLW